MESLERVCALHLASGLGAAAMNRPPGLVTLWKIGGVTSSFSPYLGDIAYKPSTYNIFATAATGIEIFSIAAPTNPRSVTFFDTTKKWGVPTSVAYGGDDGLAISVVPRTNEREVRAPTKGQVLIIPSVTKWAECGYCNEKVDVEEVGFGPDMVTFSPDGRYILVANEGPPVDYDMDGGDPSGSVSVVRFEKRPSTTTVEGELTLGKEQGPWSYQKCMVEFNNFDNKMQKLKRVGVRISGPGSSVSQDLEPKHIAVSGDSTIAYVTLQENNAVAVVDIANCRVTRIRALGYKPWGGEGGARFDASDRDGDLPVRASYPEVKGMYMPDGIAAFSTCGSEFIITANEGAPRKCGKYDDSSRVSVIARRLHSKDTFLRNDATLGRLQVTSEEPFQDNLKDLYAFGSRSISIWNSEGEHVWDSAGFIERFVADSSNGWRDYHNSEGIDSDGNSIGFDSRSDSRGPEPEAVVIAVVDTRILVFVSLERTGGFMCWDITNPYMPLFQAYVNTPGDISPQSGLFVAAEDSPMGYPLLIGSYEVSGSLAVIAVTLPD